MPTYEYRCRACGHGFDIVQSFKDEALTICPACGGELRKVFAPPAISFKGSGFYATDSRKREESASDGSKEAGGSGDAGDTKVAGDPKRPKDPVGSKESKDSKEPKDSKGSKDRSDASGSKGGDGASTPRERPAGSSPPSPNKTPGT
jgi:putative FmdB family regulatory protein